MPKVLVISNYKDYHTTRPEANIFIGLAKLGFEIHIMTYKEAKLVEEFEAVGIKVIDNQPEKKFDKGEIATIRQYIIDNKIEIVHLFNNEAIVNGIKAAKGLDVKVVLYRGYTGNIYWWLPMDYDKFLSPRVDKIFCNSVGVEQLLHRQLFFKKDKAITINKGHDLNWYSSYEEYDIRKELGLSPDAFLFINVANNRRMKGIPYLLEAFNQLPKEVDAHLLLAGKGMDDPKHLEIINTGPRKDFVHILGFRKDVLPIVKSCNSFVLSSIKGESITKSVIEAMSLGIAPIITDIPGNIELVNHKESGLVVKSKNSASLSQAMLDLYQDKAKCSLYGENARKRVATHLNTENTILQTKVMYEDLLK
jgi:L-malate glycosyltransferase